MKSWVILFKDGRHSLAWGETAEAARIDFLKAWSDGIERVAFAGEFPSPPAPENLILAPHQRVYYPSQPEIEIQTESFPKGRVYPEELPGG